MKYSISEIAKIMNLTTYTLRYYEKEGLLPNISRNEAGIRQFSDSDIEWLEVVEALKLTGMSIKDIKIFMECCETGDSTLQKRYEMIRKRKQETEKQINKLHEILDLINYNCWYYETALGAGSENIHKALEGNQGIENSYQRYLLSKNRTEKKIG